MKTVISVVALLVVASASFADGWVLKSPYKPEAKMKWKVTTDTTVSGHDIHSVVTNVLKITSKTDTQSEGTLDFTDMEINGNKSEYVAPTWKLVFAPDGSLLSAAGETECLRQLAPTTFIYPNKDVSVGDTWDATIMFGNKGKVATIKYLVTDQSKIGDRDVIKVKETLVEEAGLHGVGMFWISRDGSVLKYEINVKGWTVAGSGAPPLDAKLHGEMIKQ